VAVWWPPAAFEEWRRVGEDLGFAHVESSPLTRSSYHAREAVEAGSRSEVDVSEIRIGGGS
jgi:lipoic acid synthetase